MLDVGEEREDDEDDEDEDEEDGDGGSRLDGDAIFVFERGCDRRTNSFSSIISIKLDALPLRRERIDLVKVSKAVAM